MEMTLELIKQLKQRILTSRYLVAKMANAESLRLYFNIGHDLESEIQKNNWGDKVLDAIATRLQQELPGLRGFSASNLKKMRLFYNAWEPVKEIHSSLTNQIESNAPAFGSLTTNQFKNTNFIRLFPLGLPIISRLL